MVGEIEKRAGGGELLTLKQHRRPRSQQGQRGQRAVYARRRQLVVARAAGRVGDLVVIFQEGDKRRRRQVQRGSAPQLLLPSVPLPLIQVPPFQRGDEFL